MALDFIKKIFKGKKEKEKEEKESKIKSETSETKTKEIEKGIKEIEKKKIKEKEELSSSLDLMADDEVVFHLIKPHITEKSSFLMGQNKYVFWVNNKSNKIEIKKAIEKLYKVNVQKINIINPKPKKIRIRGRVGLRPAYKKAIITIAEGEKIEVI